METNTRVVWAVCGCPISITCGTGKPLPTFWLCDATSWEWIRWQEKSVAQVWHTKQGVYRRKARADVRDEPMQVQQWGISPMAAGSMCNCEELYKDIFLLAWVLLEGATGGWTAFVSMSGFSTWIWCHLRHLGRRILREVPIYLRRMAECRGLGRVCFTFSPSYLRWLCWFCLGLGCFAVCFPDGST